MPSVKRPIMTMKHQIYQIIKKEICNGNYAAGQWLQEKELVENICSGNWKEADRVNKIHLALAREEIIQHFESKKAVEEEKENE